jgi:MFS family permease
MERNIKVFSLFNFFSDFVFFAPVAVIYFAHVTGSFALGMSIFSIAYVSSAIFEVPTGVVSDLVGRRVTILLGAMCSVVCVVLYAVGGSYWMLALGSLFQGCQRAFYSGNNDAYLHDILSRSGKVDEYHGYLGRTSSMFQIALAIASVVGSIIASKSFPVVMWLSVIPQVCALLLATRLIDIKTSSKKTTSIYEHLKESLSLFRRNYKLQLLTSASVIRFGLGESSYFLRSAFVNSLWPLWAVGISNMLSNVGGAISYYISGKVIDKYKPLRVLSFEIVFNRIINLIALIFLTVASPAFMSATSLTYGVGSVSMNSLMQKEFTARQRATLSSLTSLGGSVVFGVCSILLGYIADIFGARFALIITNMILISPLLLYRMIFNHEKVTTHQS